MKIECLKKIRNKACFTFYLSAKDVLLDFETDNELFVKHRDLFIQSGSVFEEKFTMAENFSTSRELNELCAKTMIGIGHLLKSQKIRLEEDIANAANHHFQIWSRFGYRTTQLDYSSCIASYLKYINEANNPENASQGQTIPTFNALLTQLLNQTNEFKDKRFAYKLEKGHRVEELSVTEAKLEFIKFVNNKFGKFLNFMVLDDYDTYYPLVVDFNTLISKANELLKFRATLAAKHHDEENPDEYLPQEESPIEDLENHSKHEEVEGNNSESSVQ